jgi:hypothetical protein
MVLPLGPLLTAIWRSFRAKSAPRATEGTVRSDRRFEVVVPAKGSEIANHATTPAELDGCEEPDPKK